MDLDDWKYQFESLQIEEEALDQEKDALQQQARIITVEHTKTKAEMKQMKVTFIDQHSKATEEIHSLKELFAQKEVYSGKLVQEYTQAKEDLRTSMDKVIFLGISLDPLRASFDASEPDRDLDVKNEWLTEKYNAFEIHSEMDMSWMFLQTRYDILKESCDESFDVEVEFEKAEEAIDIAQQVMSSSIPEGESSGNRVNQDLPDEGNRDEGIESHPTSPVPQVDPSQSSSSPS